ncbi:MAG: CPBP family intramembrane metalloprotease [Pseudoxanthomonas suwonensis]|nr:CPBP family intramembrane metalloprotease [Pseudoxanthomonas suwonensis]
MKKFMAVVCSILLMLGVLKLMPAVIERNLPVQVEGDYEFVDLPDDWRARIADQVARQSEEQPWTRAECWPSATRPTDGGTVLRCITLMRHPENTGWTWQSFVDALGSFPVLSTGVSFSPKLTPFSWVNQLYFWWLPLPILLLLLRGHGWREDLMTGFRLVRAEPWLIPLAGILTAVLAKVRMFLQAGFWVAGSTASGWLVVAPVVMGPILEELIFRGVIYRWLQRAGFSVWWMAVVSSVLFMMWHGTAQWWEDPLRGWVLFVSGLIFFWVRHRSGSVLAAIAAHAITNASHQFI